MDFLKNIDFGSGTDWFGSASNAASDASSSFLGNVGGAVSHAYSAPSSDGWFSGGLDFVTRGASGAFGWLKDNPEAANLLGGVASGAGQYLAAKEAADAAAKREERMYERKRRDAMITPGELGDYGSYRSIGGKGLLTHGMLAGVRGRQ